MTFRLSTYAAYRAEYIATRLADWQQAEALEEFDRFETLDTSSILNPGDLYGFHIEQIGYAFESDAPHHLNRKARRFLLLRPTEVEALGRIHSRAVTAYRHRLTLQYGYREAERLYRKQLFERRGLSVIEYVPLPTEAEIEAKQRQIEKIPLSAIMARRGATMDYLNLGSGVVEWTELVLLPTGA